MKIAHIDLDLVSPTGHTELVLSCKPEDGVLDIHHPIESLATLLDEEQWYKDGKEYDDVGETDQLVKLLREGTVTKWDENRYGIAINIDDKEGYHTFMFSIDRKLCDGGPRHCDEVVFGSIEGPMKDNDGNEWYAFLYHYCPNSSHPHVTIVQCGCSNGSVWTDDEGDEHLDIYDLSDLPEECSKLADDLQDYLDECHRRAPISNSHLP